MHTIEDQETFGEFIKEVLEMVKQGKPFLLALQEDPERLEIEKTVIRSHHRLWHAIKGTGGFFYLQHLVYLADAYEYLMDQILSGIISLQTEHLLQLEQGNAFLEENLPGIWRQQSDDAIANEARELAADVLQSINQLPGEHEGAVTAEDGAGIEPELHRVLTSETRSLLDFIEQEFVLWDYISIDHSRLQELSTVLHRLQSNFAFFELFEFKRLVRVMELTLNRFLAGDVFHGEYPERVFIQCVDFMKKTLHDFANESWQLFDESVTSDIEKFLISLRGLIRQPIGELLVQAGLVAPETIEEALVIQKQNRGVAPRRIGEVLVEMGEVSYDDIDTILDSQRQHNDSVEKIRSELTEKESFFKGEAEGNFPDTVEVELKTLQDIVLLVKQLERDWCNSPLSPALAELKQACKPLQRKSLELLIGKIKRFVHELAIDRNKSVSFSIVGADSEIDNGIIKELYLTLIHLLYNAFDHGLETELERQQKRKKKRGSLKLVFLNKENELWVSLEDDGRGVDLKKLQGLALENNFILPGDNKPLSSQKITGLLFKVSKLQSEQRKPNDPCGLTLVDRHVQHIGGQASILTRTDRGTRVTLKIPVTPQRLGSIDT